MCFAIFSFLSATVMGTQPPSGNDNKDDRQSPQPASTDTRSEQEIKLHGFMSFGRCYPKLVYPE